MKTIRLRTMRELEGRRINVALDDGTRIDDCQLVSAARRGGTTLWLYGGQDLFVPIERVIDLWESTPASYPAA